MSSPLSLFEKKEKFKKESKKNPHRGMKMEVPTSSLVPPTPGVPLHAAQVSRRL